MGNCCKVNYNDNDLLNSPKNNKLENNNKGKDFSNDYQNQTRHNTGIENINKANTDSNKINEQKIPHDIYISKIKLKIIVKQSKCLLEGKEYLINSLGLLDSNNKNKYLDGIVIFGDVNVSKKIEIILYKFYIQTNTRTDFVFPEEESATGQNHAEIRYDKTLDLYQIRSLRGNGCFLKIDNKIVS